MSAEALLAGMSPDVRRLVEYDAKFRLHSVTKQVLEQESRKLIARATFAGQLRALAARQEARPDWGAW